MAAPATSIPPFLWQVISALLSSGKAAKMTLGVRTQPLAQA
jgi:hypothetical protein